jgi:hypothetical protein
MSRTPDPATVSSVGSLSSERRANPALRSLIDEMLHRLRDLNRNTNAWSTADHARAEAELDVIMARVRRAALDKPPA